MIYTVTEDTIYLKRPAQRIVVSAGDKQSTPQYYRDIGHRNSAIALAVKDLATRLGMDVKDLTVD